ncbi:ATP PHOSPHORIBOSYLTRANSFERASE REGULATORY SUBUNIT [Salix purpurea]|uniref:ATP PHOSPHORIBOSYLTRANSFERASE REGULATORY SUBUNIT n=1 Tax=Salix purpurea TaxID=77065 RepID=A0A9Q1A1I6_SALPP|nr:ATP PHOSPHORIBOSYLTRANSFERASE REGULATORY SUBUNIT [Salix purpurea]
MSFTVTHTSSPFSPKTHQNHRAFPSHPKLFLHFHSSKSPNSLLRASRRFSNLDDPRNWSRSINSNFADGHEDDGDDDEAEEEDRSLDLLVRFISNVFKKVSKRARKAARSVLPVPISTKLVEFSVNGVLLLAFLWVLKAFLEVVCTLGSMVFVSILLIRGIWSGVTYLQERRNLRTNEVEDDPRAWTGTQPAA